jgi:iron complex outermembrane receptor protein
LGLELDVRFLLSTQWELQANATQSKNVIQDGQAWTGKTIAFSPASIASAQLSYLPTKTLKVSWSQKYVGAQFLNNQEDSAAQLPDYWVNDLNFSYEIKPKTLCKSIVISGLVSNVLNKKYSSNGADYGGGYVYYYPQAGTHGLVGVSILF